jgi:predicted esterase YcpF (UPF0227 family)
MVYNIFISHSWKYGTDYYTVEDWIDNSDLDWKNMSVPAHDAKNANSNEELEQMIDNNIKNSTGIIIIAGMYTNYSEWIDKEIDIALAYNKPMIGIKPRGNPHIPLKISKNVNKVVNWNSSSLIDAIEEYF